MDKTLEERMNEMIEATMKVARGDYSVQVRLSGRDDECRPSAIMRHK